MARKRRNHGEIRDAIFAFYRASKEAPATLAEVHHAVEKEIGPVSRYSVNSYLWRYSRCDSAHRKFVISPPSLPQKSKILPQK